MNPDISTSYPVATLAPTVHGVDFASHASHEHSVQFYGDDSFLLEEMSRFIGSALGAGDAAIVIATKAHRDGLDRRLKARGLDITIAVTRGRYISLDAGETLSQFMVDGRPDAGRFSELIGGVIELCAKMAQGEHARVAAFGEMVALLWAEGKPEAAIELEQLWNDLARTHSFDLLCAYPMTFFSQSGDGELFGRVCGAHSHVIPAEDYISLTDEGERLRAITILQQKAQALENEIEERRKAQQALHEKNDELREAVATRDEFLSVAAHELKTPVTSLRGFAQLLLRDTRRKRDIPAERLEFALDAIELQTAKLSQLVARLLDTAQIEAGKLRIEPVRTDLVGLVHSALAQQQGGANYTFVFDGPKHLEALVDPVRFEQAITNLLDNAVKFSPHGGTVTVQLRHGDDGSIRLSVTDHGIGIPNDEREHIFGRFHQAHDERHLSGMGLGLFITREIVQLHGGFIGIEAPEDGGSRFVITLPYATGNAQTGPLA